MEKENVLHYAIDKRKKRGKGADPMFKWVDKFDAIIAVLNLFVIGLSVYWHQELVLFDYIMLPLWIFIVGVWLYNTGRKENG